MREIKFRAWSDELKEMIYLDFEKNKNLGNILSGKSLLYNEVMQYTGLKDKNGKEIYENDLCSVSNPYNNCTASGFAKVVFSWGYVGGWVLTSDGKDYLNIGTRTKSIEVVGNIYEIPDIARHDAERKSEELASNGI